MARNRRSAFADAIFADLDAFRDDTPITDDQIGGGDARFAA